jgi:glutamate 5-kinase
MLDSGAIRHLREGKSLLPIGVLAVHGEFERGAAVACVAVKATRLRAAWPTTAAAMRGESPAMPARTSKTSSAT